MAEDKNNGNASSVGGQTTDGAATSPREKRRTVIVGEGPQVTTGLRGLEERSEEVRELMGPVPGWTLRWGIALVGVLFALLLGGAWWFRYPDTLQAPCTLSPLRPPVAVVAPASGTVTERVSGAVRDGLHAVRHGDTLCLLRLPASDTVAVTAPVAGRAESEPGLVPGLTVERGRRLFTVLPASEDRGEPPLCLLRVTAEQTAGLEVGQRVQIILASLPEKDYGHIEGRIAQVGHVPEADGSFTVRVTLPSPLVTTTGRPVRIDYPTTGTAKVLLADKRVIEKILGNGRWL